MAALRTWDFPTGCRALAAGQNSSGELGLGHAQNVVRDFAPLLPPASPGAPALFGAAACGGGYTLLYDEENVATLACGEQDGGSSGLKAKTQRLLAPLPALRGVRIRALASGLSHSLALAEDGRVFAWGRNADGTPAIRPVQRLPCAACAIKRDACTMHI
jgi:alpha-tubulin suppressor-like RCC1 family protein